MICFQIFRASLDGDGRFRGLSALDSDNRVMLIFLDQSAAADSVDDYKLLQRLQRSYGVDVKAIDSIISQRPSASDSRRSRRPFHRPHLFAKKTQIHYICSFRRSAANIGPGLVPTPAN